MEREVGGGIGMGNTCKPLAVSFQFMTKSTTIKKKKKEKKNGSSMCSFEAVYIMNETIVLPGNVSLVNMIFP